MKRILDTVNSPSDLKRLTIADLDQLAAEIRYEIIHMVAKNGGHLASSLGVVELALAIHYVFDSPRDRVVWDVGHQAYAHKLLTGRRDEFYSMRRESGLSGFPRRCETEHDCFGGGHSGTSISAVLGMAEADCRKSDSRRNIAVIGDGSLTSGIAFEALNQAGHLKKDVIVILNDNEMSIAQNVGGLSERLSKLMIDTRFIHLRKAIKEFITSSMPEEGEPMVRRIKKLEELFKGLFMPGVFFEELGFKYFGPIKGHDIQDLVDNLINIKQIAGPVLFHVLTTKGKGYRPAEEDPQTFHGVGPFNVKTGKPIVAKGGCPTHTEVFSRTLVRLAEKDKSVVAITAAMAGGTGLDLLQKKFPDRFYDVGIAEQHAVTFAAGLACEGIKPIVAIYSTFLQRSYDQILQEVCLQRLPVVFAVDRGGIVGEDGATHQGLFDFSYLRHMPNMVVMAPRDVNELQHMLYTAVNHDGPIAIRYPRGDGSDVTLDEDLKLLPLGRGEVLRSGEDVTIMAIGSTVLPSLEAAEILTKNGISAAVVDCRFVKPLDKSLLTRLARQTGKAVTVEENVLQGGFGSAVLEMFETEGLADVRVKRIGLPDEFVEHGTQEQMRRKYKIDAPGIADTVRDFLGKKPRARKKTKTR